MLLSGERPRVWRLLVVGLLLVLFIGTYLQLLNPFGGKRTNVHSFYSSDRSFAKGGDVYSKWKMEDSAGTADGSAINAEGAPRQAPWWRADSSDNSAEYELPNKLVHLDLKGAAPRVDYYRQLFPLLRKLGATGVLIEYEDMFPYGGNLSIVRNGQSYTPEDIETILKTARMNRLEVVPLVQTFGHMEWVLKHEEFADLREIPSEPNVICPTAERSWIVIKDLLRQVRQLHPSITTFHIGADEAWHVADDDRCQQALSSRYHDSKMELMLAHVTRTARFLKRELKIERVLMWNDMFSETEVQLMNSSRLPQLLEPVVWGYARDVTAPGYFPDGMFDRYAEVFPRIWLGSAFKGANGPAEINIDVNRYLETHESYMRLLSDNRRTLGARAVGIVVTGWQRFDHFAGLCELLPVGIPSLATALLFLADKSPVRKPDLQQRVRRILACSENSAIDMWSAGYTYDATYVPPESTMYMQCAFPGSDLFDLVETLRFDKMQVDRFFASPTVRGWMSEYQLSRNYGSKHYARKHSQTARDLLHRLTTIEDQLKTALRAIYYPDTVEEWLYTNVRAPIQQLQNFIVRAERILTASSFPSRPLPKSPNASMASVRNDF